jgi:hypothetical protein
MGGFHVSLAWPKATFFLVSITHVEIDLLSDLIRALYQLLVPLSCHSGFVKLHVGWHVSRYLCYDGADVAVLQAYMPLHCGFVS